MGIKYPRTSLLRKSVRVSPPGVARYIKITVSIFGNSLPCSNRSIAYIENLVELYLLYWKHQLTFV